MKYILALLTSLLIRCKTPVVLKSSPEVSIAAAAIEDSFAAARVDLADKYTNTLLMLVSPPEKRIHIEPVYKNGKKIVVIPDRYKNDSIIVVGTDDWNNLLKIKDVANQLANDTFNLNNQITNVREELISQQKVKEQLAADNTTLIIKNKDIKNTNLKLQISILGLLIIIGGYLYLKFTKPM